MPTKITTINLEQHIRLHIDICILVMADENDELTQQHQELIIPNNKRITRKYQRRIKIIVLQ